MSVEREAFEKALPKPPCVWWEDAIGCYCGGNEAAEEVAEMYQSHWKTWQAARAQGEAEPGEVPHELGQAVSSWLAGHPDTDWSDSENVDAMIREAVLPNLSRVPRGSCVSQHAESDTQAPGRVPEGYALVPIEPTTRQVYAAEFPIDDVVSIRQSSQHAIAKAAYKAMIEAAPEALTTQPQPAVPEKFHVLDNHKAPKHYKAVSGDIGYINGWNAAIDAMLTAAPTAPVEGGGVQLAAGRRVHRSEC